MINKSDIKHFNIRVYGIYINDKQELLVTDEIQLNTRMTKFPGGGLKFGEGPIDCIKREAIEELNQEIEVTGHFYTTDFFQKALYYEDHQLISIYYNICFPGSIRFKISDKPFDFEGNENGNQSFRFVKIDALDPGELTFPIDRIVAQKIKENSRQTYG